MRKIPVVALMLLSFGLFVSAQKPAGDPEMPVFKSTSRLVVVDVDVTDQHGKAVLGLTRDDFELYEDRVLQRVTQFEAVDGFTPLNAAAHAAEQTETKGGSAPLTIFVLDELNTTFEEAVFSRRSLHKYLKTQPAHLASPAMIIAVTNTDFRMLHDSTQNTQELMKALDQRQSDYPWKMMKGWAKDRLARSLVALQQIAAANAGRSGRKNVVWIGRGFPSITFNGEIDEYTRITILNAINRTTSKLLKSRVTVYTIDPAMTSSTYGAVFQVNEDGEIGGPSSPPDPWIADVSFADFGPATGGRAFRWRNDISTEIAESVGDGSAYYTLAYVPTNHSDDVKYRRIRIKMRRPGLSARTRDGYFGAEIKPTQGMVALDMSQAAQNPFSYNGVQVKITETAVAGAPPKAKLMVAADARGLTWTSLPNGDLRAEVEIAVATFSAQNKMLSYDVRKFGSTNKPDQRKKLFEMPARFPIATEIPPATERLRIVVRDGSSGNIGTIDLDDEQIK